LKDVESRLVAELMKNSRRSDRELARALRVSQPTVSRMIKRLEAEGVIKEYTMIPNFIELGYKIMALTLCSLKEVSHEEYKETIAAAEKNLRGELSQKIIMFERGLGLESTGVIVSLHENYSSYVEFIDKLKEHPFLDVSRFRSFLTSLEDKVHIRPLTFSLLANHVLQMKEKKE